MKLDVALDTPLSGIALLAQSAELMNFDSAMFGDLKSDALLAVGLAAAFTDRIGVGTNIAIALARSPMMLAISANDLQTLSNGRLRLGVGTQVRAHIERRFSMPWGSPVARMRDYVLAVRSIWSAWELGSKLDYRGTHYQHTLMTPMFDPGPNPYGNPPLLLAGVGPAMTEMAGEVADGFICHAFTTPKYVQDVTLPALEKGRERSFRSSFEVVASPFIATGENDAAVEAAIDRLRRQISFYGSTPAYRDVLSVHGWIDLHDQLHLLSRQGRWDEMAALIDEDVLNAFAIVAPPTAIADKILERWAGIADRITLVAASQSELRIWGEVQAALDRNTSTERDM